VWPQAVVQTCAMHLIRINTFRLASRRDWDAIKHDVKPIYTAVNADAAGAALEELTEKWGTKYAAINRVLECSLQAGGQGQGPLPH
jgi:putative transposase